jgi:predicted lysophospholipase L1 biosynthesis ABC-type transport system permease subunit
MNGVDFEGVSLPWLPTPSASWLTIVGVAHDIRDWAHGEEDFAQLYLLQPQNPSRIMRLVVRANGNPGALASPVRQALQSLDSNLPVTEVHTMDDLLAAALARRRLATFLLAVFAAAATLLAAAGIYGVMGYAVAQRGHEIGIRMALGAKPADVLRMVLRDGMKLAGIGIALGILGLLVATRLLQSQLYSVKATDLLTLASAVAGIAAVAAAACYFPARRAMRVDPLVALRHE